MLFLEYPKCSTCKKAKSFLINKKISYVDRDITTNIPTIEELDKWIKLSNDDINKFFNTSGLKYRQLGLKEKVNGMSYKEKLELLSNDGMLIKRPLLICDNKVLIGFKESEWMKV